MGKMKALATEYTRIYRGPVLAQAPAGLGSLPRPSSGCFSNKSEMVRGVNTGELRVCDGVSIAHRRRYYPLKRNQQIPPSMQV